MHIDTTIDSVKVTFDLQTRESEMTDVAKSSAKSGAKSGAKITPRQEAILSLISNNPNITLDEIAKEMGIGSSTLDREVAKMSHLLRREGPKKGGHWEIVVE